MTCETSQMYDNVVVVGAGIIGLASALLLAEDGIRITIVARDLPGDECVAWASPWAGANLIPPPDMGHSEMAKESFEWYSVHAEKDPSTSIRVVKATEFYTDRSTDDSLWYKEYCPDWKILPTDGLPPKSKLGVSFKTCIVNPDYFLPWVQRNLDAKGTKFIRAELKSLGEARKFAPDAQIIINASGLGAQKLAHDDDVTGYRGQTMFVKSDYSEVKMMQGSEYTYVIPRMFSGGVILGGISQEGNTNSSVDVSLRHDILERVNNMTGGAFAHIDVENDVIRDIVGIRPGRHGGIRVAREGDVIHAYGFKGAGYIYSFGAAAQVRRLLYSQ